MNRLDNLKDLRNLLLMLDAYDTLEVNGEKIGFDMEYEYFSKDYSGHSCGSACCIAGWVNICNPETSELELGEALLTICPDHVSLKEACNVCWGGSRVNPLMWSASPRVAARVIELLEETGEERWDQALEEFRVSISVES